MEKRNCVAGTTEEKGMKVERGRFTGKVFFCILCIILAGGCGRKGDPIAPRPVLPGKVGDLSAHPRGKTIVLSWSIPGNNSDGSAFTDLEGFKILRSEQPFGRECPECPKRFALLFDMDYKTHVMEKQPSPTVEYRDRKLTPETVYTYLVVSYTTAGRHGSRSNSQVVYWDVPCQPPWNLQEKLEGTVVTLSWNEPVALAGGGPLEGLAGYNLYRRSPDESYPSDPLNGRLITSLACRDRGAEPDRDYLYVVRSVRRVRKSLVESEPSEELAVNTTDRTPPATPAALVAIPTEAGIVLKWQENEESDLRGYNLYRKTGGAGDFVACAAEPLLLPSYLDENVERNETYTYRVTAIDEATRPNESDPSREVTLRYNY